MRVSSRQNEKRRRLLRSAITVSTIFDSALFRDIIFQCTDHFGRDTSDETVIRHILCDHGSGSNDHVIADVYPRQNCDISADPDIIPYRYRLADTEMFSPPHGCHGMIDRGDHRVRPDHFTVRSQLGKIRSILRDATEPRRFEDLFSEDAGKMEIIVTFMALLEMIAHGEIHLKQTEPYAPITVWQKRLLDEDADYAYMDELTEEEQSE